MNNSMRKHAVRVAFLPLLLTPLALLSFASCVTQERYDDAQLNAKHYQSKTLDAEKRASDLEEENRHLRAQLDASDKSLTEAGFNPSSIDERLQNLSNILKEVGGQPGDVTKFAVDGGYVYRVKDSILFTPGSSEVSNDGQKVLGEVAADINSRPHGKVYVRGHTDNVPIVKAETVKRFPRGNLQLSAARAVEVAGFLAVTGKVEESRLVVMGFGPSDPVAPNDSDTNRQKNRRVDIFVANEETAAGDTKPTGTAQK
jgi:chemotaxis protein MotB